MTTRRKNKPAAAPRINRGIATSRSDPDYARFTRWHWGVGPGQKVEWDDPDLPDRLIEIGRLVELHVQRNPKSAEPLRIVVPAGMVERCHLAFDPSHRHERIYILLDPKVQSAVREKIGRAVADEPAATLAAIAQDGSLYRASKIPHRHATRDYPRIEARVIGPLTHVVYRTEKKGDGLSEYIHEMGEEGGIPPVLCVSDDGRLWICGGTYVCMIAGIAY